MYFGRKIRQLWCFHKAYTGNEVCFLTRRRHAVLVSMETSQSCNHFIHISLGIQMCVVFFPSKKD